ncbi:hypothetical protein [Maribacter antarcticus]|uniref:hypothetical protein n=1 Tax=Maribacter antarcticus TaxID=505250 RepID=UPI00047A15DD|nr:hypothetical protein [Maribacter antarcticus]
MIQIFRPIRKDLMEKNKFRKYLAYAVGEIILVIIGILIALAINEQSKNKNNLELRDLYIIQLSDEADRNIKQLTEYENGAIEMLKELDTLFQLLVNKEYDNLKLSAKVPVLLRSNKFYPVMITYDNLKFSGDLNLIGDLILRNSISETYETFNPIKRFESLDHQGIAVFYENFWMPNVRFRYMGNAAEDYGKEVYFENIVFSRMVTIAQNRDAYANSIVAFKKLKNTFVTLKDNK